jgi:hypothetical protein
MMAISYVYIHCASFVKKRIMGTVSLIFFEIIVEKIEMYSEKVGNLIISVRTSVAE